MKKGNKKKEGKNVNCGNSRNKIKNELPKPKIKAMSLKNIK